MPSHLPITSTNDLRADCSNCFALCCTAFGFFRSADFAEDKPAGEPCRHLGPKYDCSIHDVLRPRGFRGCAVFDCFGAGQLVSRQLFDGVGWRERPDTRRSMFSAFAVVRQLHEMLWFLSEARMRTNDADLVDEIDQQSHALVRLTRHHPDRLTTVNPDDHRSSVRALLLTVSDEVRASYCAEDDEFDGQLVPYADLAGACLQERVLCGADLRGACLIGADLRGSDLTAVDLLGADTRAALVSGADLSASLFLTQSQVNAMHGDHSTQLSTNLSIPPHWSGR